MSDLDLTEAIEAAARAMQAHTRHYAAARSRDIPPPFDDLGPGNQETLLTPARVYLAAAAPLIERQVRERVVAEIEALAATCHGSRGDSKACGSLWRRGLGDAARIARGEAS
jgi:hypothetical protein